MNKQVNEYMNQPKNHHSPPEEPEYYKLPPVVPIPINDQLSLDQTEDHQLPPDQNHQSSDKQLEESVLSQNLSEISPIIVDEHPFTIKCIGYEPQINGNIFNNFPFQYLSESPDIVFENKHLHSRECMENDYVVFSKSSRQYLNRSCEMLAYSTKLRC